MITLILTVLCQGPIPVRTEYAVTNAQDFKTDVYLLQKGWYNPDTGLRCRAMKVKYMKGNKYE